MHEGNLEENEVQAQAAKAFVDKLVSFSSRDQAVRFLHQYSSQINQNVVELLKGQVAHNVRVDVDRALMIADLTREAAALVGDALSEALSCHALAMALDCSGKYTHALGLYNKAQSIYQSLGQDVEAARLARGKLPVLMYLGRYDEALQVADEARQQLQKHNQMALVAQVDANVGSLYERLAQYHTALTYYQRAAEVFDRLDDRRSLATVQTNLAIVHFYLNQFEQSLALYAQARQTLQDLGLHLLAVQVDYNVACLYFRRGRFDHALKQFGWVETEALNHGDITQAALCKLDLAEAYLQLNALEDALEASQAAIIQFTELQMSFELAKAKMYQGMTHLHLGAFDHAATLLEAARTLFSREGNEIYQALCDLYLSEVALKQGNWDQAINLCQTASQIFETNQLAAKAAYAQFQLAKIHLQADNLPAATSCCQQAAQTMESLDAPWLKYQCFHFQGRLADRDGKKVEAYNCFKQAINHIEEMRSTIRVDEFKATFVKDKLRVYEDMVRLCLGAGSRKKQREAFTFVEAAKSRALVELLSRALEMKSKGKTKVGQDLTQRWNTLREELDWYYNKFNEYESEPPPRSPETGQRLQREIRQREVELTKLMRQIQIKDPESSSLQTVSYLTGKDVSKELDEDETLLEYYLIGNEIWAFAIDRTGLRETRRVSYTNPTLDRLRKLRFQLNKHLLVNDYIVKYKSALRRFTDEHLQALYEELVEPMAGVLKGNRLAIVPHGFLHYVPFHALFDGKQYLIDRYEVSYCPSAQVLRLCRGQDHSQETGRSPALIMGVPDEKLPHINEEVETIRKILPGSETLLGEEATLEQFKRLAEQCQILHLASHAIFRQDNPLFSALRLANSWLNFYDIFRLDLQADLVTLSACQTGVNKVFAGDELVGLMRGFLYAGAPSLLLSLWAVNDRSTAEFMTAFYRLFRQGHSARAALREAQLAIREDYPHPYYWAPFVLMGRP